MTDLEVDSDQPVKQLPSEYFRAAAQFQALEAEATTPRVRQHLRTLIDEARLSGYRDLYVDTLPSMTSALNLYKNMGFAEVGPYSDDPTQGAVYLHLRL